MSRPLRIELSGGVFHVTSRGNRREDIFLCDEDRDAWLLILAQVCKRFNWVCHAYCLMSNHYHLVIETPEANLALGMRQLNGVYTQSLNRKYARVGHVFQGRYKAILVEREGYLLEFGRYVVLNPVRAHMVSDVADWPWSSYGAMIGEVPAPPWLQTDWLLAQFSQQRKRAQLAYHDFVRDGIGLPSVWDGLKGQIFLGSDDFVTALQASLDDSLSFDEIPRAQRRPIARPLAEYVSYASGNKAAAMVNAYRSGEHSMSAIARAFGVHYSTVSRAVKAAEA
jgi:putative transposase